MSNRSDRWRRTVKLLLLNEAGSIVPTMSNRFRMSIWWMTTYTGRYTKFIAGPNSSSPQPGPQKMMSTGAPLRHTQLGYRLSGFVQTGFEEIERSVAANFLQADQNNFRIARDSGGTAGNIQQSSRCKIVLFVA